MATAETALLVAGYADLPVARRGFRAIRDLYYETRALDRMDAVVLARQPVEEPSAAHMPIAAVQAGQPTGTAAGLASRLAAALAPSFAVDRISPPAREVARDRRPARDITVGLDIQTRREFADLITTSAAALLVVVEPSMLRPVQGIVAEAQRLGGAEIQVAIDSVGSGAVAPSGPAVGASNHSTAVEKETPS